MKSENQSLTAKQLASRRYYYKHKEKVAAYKKAYNEKHKERNAKRAKLYRQANKEELVKREKEFREKNKDILKERYKVYCKSYNERHKERVAQRRKQSRAKHRDKVSMYNTEYHRQRRNNDQDFRIRHIFRTAVSGAFRRIKQNKPTNTQKLLGCSWEEAKAYIENLFEEGMTWENHGVGKGCWHIDHIRPVTNFDIDELPMMNNIKNLQPLWSEENILKGNKYDKSPPLSR